jgi:hypothetical protein
VEEAMQDRRQLFRNRVYYGGELAFNGRSSTLACIVRNFSTRGVKIAVEGSAVLPDKLDLTIERKGLSCLARLVWRNQTEAGLVFADAHAPEAVVPLDWARKLAASERINRRLQSRIEQLRSEH